MRFRNKKKTNKINKYIEAIENWDIFNYMDDDWSIYGINVIQALALLNKKRSPESISRWENWMKTMISLKIWNKEITSFLGNKSISINIENKSPDIFLLSAIILKSKETVTDLLNRWVDINNESENWTTPLILAIADNNEEIIKILLDKWAETNKKVKEWWTAVIIASIFWNPEIVKLLIKYWADVNIKTNDWMTALKRAKENLPDERFDYEVSLWKYSRIIKILEENWAK